MPEETKRPESRDSPPRTRWWPLVVYLPVLAVVFYVPSYAPGTAPEHVRYGEFMGSVRSGRIVKAEISGTRITGRNAVDAESAPGEVWTERIPGNDGQGLIDELQARGVPFSGQIENTSWIYPALWLLPVLVILGISRSLWRTT